MPALLPLLLTAVAAGAGSPRSYWPTSGWRTATPESVGMSSAGLANASAWVGSLAEPDAFVVIKGGYIVAEKYWGETDRESLHDLESGTKSIGAIALAHAIHAGHFNIDTNVTDCRDLT